MVAISSHDGRAQRADRRQRRTVAAAMAAFLNYLCEARQRAMNRRLAEELPDHLLQDIGISRAELGLPPAAETPDILRDIGGWR